MPSVRLGPNKIDLDWQADHLPSHGGRRLVRATLCTTPPRAERYQIHFFCFCFLQFLSGLSSEESATETAVAAAARGQDMRT